METGLDYMHARYYANMQGRFISPDTLLGSIANPQSLNRYAYVRNNPLNLSDPSGHRPSGAPEFVPAPRTDGGAGWLDDPMALPPDVQDEIDRINAVFAEDESSAGASEPAPAHESEAPEHSAVESAEPPEHTETAPTDAGEHADPQNTETAADLAQRASDGLSNHPGLLEEMQSNTASGVDVHIVACQAAKESNYKSLSQIPIPRKNAGAYISGAVGPDGEIGLLQIFPSTAGVSAAALKSVATNVKAATSYLMGIKNHFNVGMREALAIYNWGPGKFNEVDRDVTRIFSGSLSYADKILDCSRHLYLPTIDKPFKFLPR